MNDTISQTPRPQSTCRLCLGTTYYYFSLDVLHKYKVAYYRCDNCHSLQTELPFWISEAYNSNLAILDTGAAQRNFANLAATYAVSCVLRMNNVLDFGGGDGLLCRLLRDYEINCFVDDKYAAASYAQPFVKPNFSRPDILLAFEVLEHFENPTVDLEVLFQSNPDVLLISTGIFSGQDATWWYLTPETGQHLFFYSKEALALIAQKYSYRPMFCSNYVLLARASCMGGFRAAILRVLLHKLSLRILSALMRLMPTRGVMRDFNALRKKMR